MYVLIWTDGASQRNNTLASIGVVIKTTDDDYICEISKFIGAGTSNQAEYKAFIEGIREAKKLGADRGVIYVDSEVVVKQMTGIYAIRNETLIELSKEAKRLLENTRFEIKHIRGTLNKEAHNLAYKAVKRIRDREKIAKKIRKKYRKPIDK